MNEFLNIPPQNTFFSILFGVAFVLWVFYLIVAIFLPIKLWFACNRIKAIEKELKRTNTLLESFLKNLSAE